MWVSVWMVRYEDGARRGLDVAGFYGHEVKVKWSLLQQS